MGIRVSELSNYVVPGVDVVSGDVIIFVDAGQIKVYDDGTKRLQIQVELADGRRKLLSLNNTSIKNLASKYGDDTSGWVGKSAIVTISEQNVRGNMKKVIYLTPAI
jgi:hypothetical protein